MALLPFGSAPGKGGGGGGTTFTTQDHLTARVDANTIIDGIAAKGTSQATATWTLIKLILTDNDRLERQEYRATDSWTNRLSATYTLTNTYSN